jgi:hypothetical protein
VVGDDVEIHLHATRVRGLDEVAHVAVVPKCGSTVVKSVIQ